jgi:para-nitrobenzyl esterase
MSEVTAPSGRWRGQDVDGVTVFHGIRYAHAQRFAPPSRAASHTHVVDATVAGPIAPQLPGQLEAVIGRAEPLTQSEDCLRVTVTTPEGAAPGSLPVLVWLHGGAFLTGSGEWNLYDGGKMAREASTVVVTVSYRVGVLGYLGAPGVSPGNLGLLDQATALEWVRDNISAFGGDPHRVTLAGQSAGAQSVALLMGVAPRLFSRAIIQSGPMGVPPQSPAEADAVAQVFLAELNADPQRAAMTEILAAQGRTVAKLASPLPILRPMYGSDPLPDENQWKDTLASHAPDTQVVIGTTKDEIRAFTIPTTAANAMQDHVFDAPTWRFADTLVTLGADVHRYQFQPLDAANPLGACHCIELPLLFGRDSDWQDAAMLSPLSPKEIDAIGANVRATWGSFIHSGEFPGPTHSPGARTPILLP